MSYERETSGLDVTPLHPTLHHRSSVNQITNLAVKAIARDVAAAGRNFVWKTGRKNAKILLYRRTSAQND